MLWILALVTIPDACDTDFVPGGILFEDRIYNIIISQLSSRRRCPHTAENYLTAEKGSTSVSALWGLFYCDGRSFPQVVRQLLELREGEEL